MTTSTETLTWKARPWLGGVSLVVGIAVGVLAVLAAREWLSSGRNASAATALFGTFAAWAISLGVVHVRRMPMRALAAPAAIVGLGGLAWGGSLLAIFDDVLAGLPIALGASAPFLLMSARHGWQARGRDPWLLSILVAVSLPIAVYALLVLLVGMGMPRNG